MLQVGLKRAAQQADRAGIGQGRASQHSQGADRPVLAQTGQQTRQQAGPGGQFPGHQLLRDPVRAQRPDPVPVPRIR